MMNVIHMRSKNDKLYIANIIEEGKLGGPQNRILYVAKNIEQNVETVIIMPEDNSTEFQQRCKSLGVPFKVIALSRITKELKAAFRYIWFSPWEIIQLVRLLRQEKFDLIEVSGGSWQYKGAISGKLAGIPVLWHLNDTFMPLVFRKFFGLLSGLASGYSYASERTRNYYKPYIKNNRYEITIQAPVDTRRFDPFQEFPDDELIPDLVGKLVVGIVANPSPVKGLETFLKMAAHLQNDSSLKLAFVVIGNVYRSQKSYFKSLKNFEKLLKINNLYWAGGRSDIRSLLKRYDVYVCSSIKESSPTSVWEAMSMSKPIVSTDVGDVRVYIKHDQNGFIVPVRDAEKLSLMVKRLLVNKTKRNLFGLQSRKISKDHLDIAICGNKQFAFYKKMIKTEPMI